MTKKEILEKAKSKDGLWVLQRNITAEKVFPAEALSPEQIYTPVKLVYGGELLEIISFSSSGTPFLYAYSEDEVDIYEEDGQPVLCIRGEKKYYDSYPEPEETREEFIEHFIHCWNLSPEEYEKYGVKKETENLTVLGVERLAK